MKTKTTLLAYFYLSACFALVSLPAVAASAPNLFSNAPQADRIAGQAATASKLSKKRIASVNFAELGKQKHRGARLQFNLFSDLSLEGTVEKIEERSKQNYSLTGHFGRNRLATFAISVVEDVTAINVRTAEGEFYQVRSLPDGTYEIRAVENEVIPECSVTPDQNVKIPAAAGALNQQPQALSDSGELIDVMVVYTPSAKNAAGGSNQIAALINLAIAESNTAYQQSLINTRVRLVYAGEINYTESTNSAGFEAALNAITDPSDGTMDTVNNLRNTYGADLVSLWINNGTSCGLGWVMSTLSPEMESQAFSVVHWSCATGYYSFAHEMAHNMGCTHNREDTYGVAGLYSYSYGWRFDANGKHYRTIMSYDLPGQNYYQRIQMFSNPDLEIEGVPTGVEIGQPNESHNAQTINNSALTVANFRPTAVPSITNQPQSRSVNVGENVTFSVNANGSLPLYYSWQKGGSAISGATSSNYTITNVQPSDTNNYSVVVSNTLGTATSIAADLSINTIGDAVENNGFTWDSFNTTPWQTVTTPAHDGVDAAESGSIGSSEFSILQTPIVGPGTISFWWKVSSEEGADYLDILLDGNALFQYGISGNQDWAPLSYSIPAGEHTFGWRYSKDSLFSDGQDKGWVDQVSYVAGSSFPTASLNGTNKPFHIVFNGRAGADYTLQGSTNLTNWVTLTNVLSASTNHLYIDTNSSTLPHRFYRVTSP